MAVSDSWLVNISLGMNTTLIQTENFNSSLLVGVMPTQSSPYQCPPTSWGTDPFKVYSSASDFNLEFDPIIAAAKIVGDVVQINRFTWLQDAVATYFACQPSPLTLVVGKMEVPVASTNYSTALSAIAAANNNWYSFSICDDIPVESASADNFSILNVTMNLDGEVSFPAGTVAVFSGATPTKPYLTILENLNQSGTLNLSVYSLDMTTHIPVNAVTGFEYGGVPIAGVTVTSSDVNGTVAYTLSKVTMTVTAIGTASVLAGARVASTTITPFAPYVCFTNNVLTLGANNADFYSSDNSTVIPIGAMTNITYGGNPISNVVYPQTNNSTNVPFVPEAPSLLTPVTGVLAALSNFRSASVDNPKLLFLDTKDPTVAQAIQLAGGSESMLVCYHSLNLQAYTTSLRASLSAINLSQYFVDIFSPGVGLKPFSSMKLTSGSTPFDPTINTGNIGKPGTPGNSSNLIGWNNNIYAEFGQSSGLGLMQFGYMSNSTSSAQVYLDEIVGSDFLKLTAQADLISYIINAQSTGGIDYDDIGIQGIVSIFRGSVQKAVAQNILQQPPNSAFVYKSYAQVDDSNIANRVYKDLQFNGKFLSRIQNISVKINLSL